LLSIFFMASRIRLEMWSYTRFSSSLLYDYRYIHVTCSWRINLFQMWAHLFTYHTHTHTHLYLSNTLNHQHIMRYDWCTLCLLRTLYSSSSVMNCSTIECFAFAFFLVLRFHINFIFIFSRWFLFFVTLN